MVSRTDVAPFGPYPQLPVGDTSGGRPAARAAIRVGEGVPGSRLARPATARPRPLAPAPNRHRRSSRPLALSRRLRCRLRLGVASLGDRQGHDTR